MGHPAIDNQTGFALEPAFLTDEENRPLFVPIIKATFRIDEQARLVPADRQVPVNFAGIFNGPPDISSYRYEPEGVPPKATTDCVLIGHAHGGGNGQVDVGFRVGPVHKLVRVFGDRRWYKSMGSVSMTPAERFDKLPLVYERAFGGWDRSHADPGEHSFEARNPVGAGFRARWSSAEELVPLPNLEDPAALISSFDDRPAPAGFGFISPHWVPRNAYAGTYDEAWIQNRAPRLPADFNRLYFNGASPGLRTASPLRGDEPVTVINASAHGRIDFALPGVPAPVLDIEMRRKQKRTLQTALDTVIVDMDDTTVTLIWRAQLVVRDVPDDIVAVVATIPAA